MGEIRAKQEEKIGQRKLQINPFGMWMMTSHRQCPRGGACECPRVGGVFQILGGWMTSREQCPRGGACGYLCKISGKSTPLPPLTKAFPYAYAGNDTDGTPTPAELHPAISFTPGFRGSGLQGDVHACTPSSIWSGPKDVSLVTAMCDRDYIAGEAQMHRKLRCDTG